MNTNDYSEKCQPPIPIGIQRYAYQCENIAIQPLRDECHISAFPPSGKGKDPYPNPEADHIRFYELKITRFTGNAIEITFTKKFKDGSEYLYLTNVSFSDLVNRIFTGKPANHWQAPIPTKQFE